MNYAIRSHNMLPTVFTYYMLNEWNKTFLFIFILGNSTSSCTSCNSDYYLCTGSNKCIASSDCYFIFSNILFNKKIKLFILFLKMTILESLQIVSTLQENIPYAIMFGGVNLSVRDNDKIKN